MTKEFCYNCLYADPDTGTCNDCYLDGPCEGCTYVKECALKDSWEKYTEKCPEYKKKREKRKEGDIK